MRILVFLVVSTLPLLSACGEQGSCLADGVRYEELPEGSIFNGTCVPEGQRFGEQFDCDLVEGPCTDAERGQPSVQVIDPDPERLTDPDLGWASAQVASCSCSCCHNDAGVSAYVWSHDFANEVWTDSMNTDRLRALAEYPVHTGNILSPDENHGFHRDQTGLPTTDPDRLRAFLEREIARRGDR